MPSAYSSIKLGLGFSLPWLQASLADKEAVASASTSAINTSRIPDFDPPYPFLSHGPPTPAHVFVGDFETGDLSQWTSLEAVANDSIQIVSSPVRAGKYAGRFRLRPGEFLHHGNRAEITHDLLDAPGSEGWYAWSVFVPEDGYPDDPDPSHWQILAQFHDQPNTDLGWTWEDFPPHNSSIALYYQSVPARAIGLGFGLNLPKGLITHGPVPVEKDKWIDILFHIGWSTGDDGFVEAWVNNQRLTGPQGAKGRTLYYAWYDYHKLGIYRDPNSTTTVELYLDEFRTGPTQESVAIPPLAGKQQLRQRL